MTDPAPLIHAQDARLRALRRLAEEFPDRFRQLVVEEVIKASAVPAKT